MELSLKIAICDDNNEQLKDFLKLLNSVFTISVPIASFDDAYSLECYLHNLNGDVDIVVLDIDLNNENGIEVAQKIKTEFPNIKVIFVTGYIDYAKDIFNADPLYFLVKPVQKEKLEQAFLKAQEIIVSENQNLLTIAVEKRLIKIPVRSILYLESVNKFVHIHTCQNETYITKSKLDEIYDKIRNNLIRCHKSYAVNIDKIKVFGKETLTLTDNIEIPISRSNFSESKCKYMIYLGEKL